MSFFKDLGMPKFTAGDMVNVNQGDWRLQVEGLMASPREFSLADIASLPQSEVDARLTSVSGFSVRARWQGVLWRDFLPALDASPEASHADFISMGGGYSTCVSLKDLDHPRVMLVLGVSLAMKGSMLHCRPSCKRLLAWEHFGATGRKLASMGQLAT